MEEDGKKIFMVSGTESSDEWGIQCEIPITEYMTRLAIRDITSST
jgi:hypothetical protein